MKKYTFTSIGSVVVGIFLSLTLVSAQETDKKTLGIMSAFRQFADIDTLAITVPTVVELPVETDFFERYDFAVLDNTARIFEPYYFVKKKFISLETITVTSNGNASSAMTDNNPQTYSEFIVSGDAPGIAQIQIRSNATIISSALTILLDNHVAMPNTVEIRAMTETGEKIVVATRRLDQNIVKFPRTASRQWTVTLTYVQPLRITELRLDQENFSSTETNAVRFLAQPGHSYRIFMDPDRFVDMPITESGNLVSNADVMILPWPSVVKNPGYAMADIDADGTPDIRDNCVEVENSSQEDINNNSRGDVCDDFDKDGILNYRDNCPNNPNANQADEDADAIGNACDQEESRITERNPWLPWAGIGFALAVLITLFVITVRHPVNKSSE